MISKLSFTLLLAIFSCHVVAGEWCDYKKFSGSYNIYGGELGDINQPKKGDRKIAINVDQKMAQDVFDSIGPDVKGEAVCVADPRDRFRQKGNIQCIRSHDARYSCTFGFDLTTGTSIIGSIC